MATIINNPPSSGDNSGSSVGIMVIIFVLVVAAGLFFIYGLPAISNMGTPSVDVNIKLPPGVPPATTPAP